MATALCVNAQSDHSAEPAHLRSFEAAKPLTTLPNKKLRKLELAAYLFYLRMHFDICKKFIVTGCFQ
jgi:hypothetical protein